MQKEKKRQKKKKKKKKRNRFAERSRNKGSRGPERKKSPGEIASTWIQAFVGPISLPSLWFQEAHL